MKSYPVCLLHLDLKRSVVIGGGSVASRKVEALLEAGALVEVISPDLTPELQALSDSGLIRAFVRPYMEGDLADAFLVIAATDDPQLNERVWAEARRCGCLINVVDDPAHCDFSLPAVVRRGDLSIAISTGGGSPALARRLRERFEAMIGPEYADLTALLAGLRPELLASFPAGDDRLKAALRLVDSDLLNILQTCGMETALSHGRKILHQC